MEKDLTLVGWNKMGEGEIKGIHICSLKLFEGLYVVGIGDVEKKDKDFFLKLREMHQRMNFLAKRNPEGYELIREEDGKRVYTTSFGKFIISRDPSMMGVYLDKTIAYNASKNVHDAMKNHLWEIVKMN